MASVFAWTQLWEFLLTWAHGDYITYLTECFLKRGICNSAPAWNHSVLTPITVCPDSDISVTGPPGTQKQPTLFLSYWQVKSCYWHKFALFFKCWGGCLFLGKSTLFESLLSFLIMVSWIDETFWACVTYRIINTIAFVISALPLENCHYPAQFSQTKCAQPLSSSTGKVVCIGCTPPW